MKAAAKALAHPAIAGVLISICVLLAVLATRQRGLLQPAEVAAYDQFQRWRSGDIEPEDRIVVVGTTEDDLRTIGHPIDDESLGRVLDEIVKAGATIVGLDLYRDLPEPRNRSLLPRLEQTLLAHENIIAIRRLGGRDTQGVAAPECLRDKPDRIAPNNLPTDSAIDGKYRRGYLFVAHENGEQEPSFALVLALSWLNEHHQLAGEDDHGFLRIGKTTFVPLNPNAGGYVGADHLGQAILIDFRGPREVRFPHEPAVPRKLAAFSFGDVLAAKVPPDALRGKIVLVATLAESVKDFNATPVQDELRGVVTHALVIHQLLRGALDGVKPMQSWPEKIENVWIALWTFLGGGLGLAFRSPWKLAIALALLVGAIGLAAWEFFLHGTWVLVDAPALGCSVAATFVTSFTVWREHAERAVMQTLFSKHVSTKVADALWTNRDAFLDGKRMRPKWVVATVLFTDLKSFSTTSEKMDPATLMDWMNEYMDAIGRHVEPHDGIINKFIGDAIMAIFGAPISHVDEAGIDRDAVNAVECALAMEKTLIELNEDWTRRGLPTTEMRVGIFTGPLVTGSLGTSDRLEFTVLGDTVNTAARLESAGKEATGPDMPKSPCTILIGASTFERLRGRYQTIPLGAMSLKGKAEKISVHRVIGIAPVEITTS